MTSRAQDDDLVMNLVEIALTMPSEERRAYLEGACAGDPELLEAVWNYTEAEARMQGFLADPLFTPFAAEHPFEPGELLEGRFRIVREVARGGMGIVYEAVDEKLDRRIALKCAQSGYRKRLPPEVRNASEISHPNVCKIFEIHTAATSQGEIEFLTMEFLEGEPLSALLARGPLPVVEAQTIARQICAGVAEAHRRQVVHGDLKSGNVIVTREPDGSVRAVITDFGLARRPGFQQRTGQTGQLRGTPNYMAPELWKGEPATIATDIFALGVILRELAPAVKSGGPAKLWERVVDKCTAASPESRLRTADEVAAALSPRTRRWVLAAAATVAVSVFTGVLTYVTATGPAESVRLAVLPFESDQNGAPVAVRLTDEVSRRVSVLRGSPSLGLTVLPAAEAIRVKAVSAQAAARTLGATHVLRGSLRRSATGVEVQAYLTDTRSMVNRREWKAVYQPGELRFAATALAGVVTGSFHLPVVRPRVNAAARDDYLAGLNHLRRNSTIDLALPLLERAVATDWDSPQTHAGLAEGRWWKYSLSGDPAWRDRAAESVRDAEKRSPDLPEVLRVAGLLKADAGWYEQAESDYVRAIELDPADGDAQRRLGLVYDANNDPSKALAAYRRSVELDPKYYRNHQALGNFYKERADYAEAAIHFKQAVALAPNEPVVHFILGTLQMNLGQFPEAERELRTSLRLGETPTALNTLGAVLMYMGRDREAVPCFTRALSERPGNFLWWMNLGTAYRRLSMKADSDRANRRSLDLVETEMRKNPRSGYVRACLAYLCARLGDRRRSESEAAQALQLSPDDGDVRRLAVKTYEALGRREASLSVLRGARADVLADVARYPDLADLGADPRFQLMLKPNTN